MLTYAAALTATETARTEPASGSTQRDCASFVLYPDGRISNWNEPAEQMLGYSEEQALGATSLGSFRWTKSSEANRSACCVSRARTVSINGKAPGCGKTIHGSGRGSGYWRCAAPLEP